MITSVYGGLGYLEANFAAGVDVENQKIIQNVVYVIKLFGLESLRIFLLDWLSQVLGYLELLR